MATAELDEPTIATHRELDPELFDIRHDVPVFSEHEADDGTVYTREILESIAENQNKRIRDTGDYTAICIGHTPTPEEKAAGVPMPEVVGYAGPYYVGMIGDEEPRYAILAKNFAIYREDRDKVKRYARRSVEIYEEDDPHDRYFDPIALLGAEMPRLNLGLAYSRVSPDRKIRRYAAAAPSDGNVFVPSEHYQQPIQATNQEAEPMAANLSEEDIAAIVSAIEQTDWAQYAIQQMMADQAKGDETPVEDEPMGGMPPVDAGAPPMDGALPDDMGGDPAMGGDPGMAPPAGDVPPPVDAGGAPMPEEDELPAQYSRTRSLIARYRRENTELKSQVEQLQKEKLSVQRYSRIGSLAAAYVMDVEEERRRADSMTDAQFEDFYGDHGIVVTRYHRNPVGRGLMPEVIAAEKLGGDDKNSAEKVELAKRVATRYANKGTPVTFAEAMALVDKGEKA